MITYASKCFSHTFNMNVHGKLFRMLHSLLAAYASPCPPPVLLVSLSPFLFAHFSSSTPTMQYCLPLLFSSIYIHRIYFYMAEKFYIVFDVPFSISFIYLFIFCLYQFYSFVFVVLALPIEFSAVRAYDYVENLHTYSIIMHVISITIYGITIFRVSLFCKLNRVFLFSLSLHMNE